MTTIQPPNLFLPLLRRIALTLVFVCWLLPVLSAGAQAPTTLSGRVTSAEGEPLVGALLTMHRYVEGTDDAPGYWDPIIADVQTDENGQYAFTRLIAGVYRLQVGSIVQTGKFYIGEFYENQESLEAATDIVVVDGATLTGYDFVLSRHGLVAGTVVDPDNQPIEGIQVEYWNDFGFGPIPMGSAVTDAAGAFAFSFSPGSVNWLSFNDYSGRFLAEFYDNKSDIAGADAVSIGIDETITLTVALSRTKTISGVVTDGLDVPVSGANVSLYKLSEPDNWSQQATTVTDAQGNYHIENLFNGHYKLEFSGPSIVQEFYDNRASFLDADIIDLNNSPQNVVVNAVVARLGVITGTVSDTHGTPLAGIEVGLYDEWGNLWFGAPVITGPDGDYRIEYAPPTQGFRVKFQSNGLYVNEYYDNALTIEAAQPVTVPLETLIPNINAQLDRYGIVTGTVTNEQGAPIQNVSVQPYWDPEGTGTWTVPSESVVAATTDAAGNYGLRLLPEEDFRIGFTHAAHEAEFYDNQPTVATATNISASLNTVVPNINAQLVAGPVVSGTITGHNGIPLRGVRIEFLRYDAAYGYWLTTASTESDVQGKYAVGLLAGTYRLWFQSTSPDYVSEYYPDAATVEEAEDIVLADGATLTVDAQLAVVQSISGRVTTSNSVPDFIGQVLLRKRVIVDGEPVWECCTYLAYVDGFSGGNFRFENIEPGEYIVQFSGFSGFYRPEYYPNQTLEANATIFTVTEDSYFPGIDAVIEELGALDVTVVNANNQPLSGIGVTLLNEAMLAGKEDILPTTTTDAKGSFRLRVDESPRWLHLEDPFFGYYAGEFYNNAGNIADADAIVVPAATAVTLTVTLSRSVVVTGQVTNLPGQPLDGVAVSVFTHWPQHPDVWRPMLFTYGTDATGNYRISGLSPYTRYRLKFEKDGHILYYPNAATIEEAEDVVLTTQPLLPNINVVLGHPDEVKAGFEGTPLSGTGSLTVTFSDQSLGPVSSREWDFGDGTGSSQLSPSHVYTTPGVYTVTLIVTGSVNSDIEQKMNYVSLVDSPVSQLALHAPSSARVNRSVAFSATVATGDNVIYTWDFGDGESATGQAVNHIYTKTGRYTVTLTAGNSRGQSEETHMIIINFRSILLWIEQRK